MSQLFILALVTLIGLITTSVECGLSSPSPDDYESGDQYKKLAEKVISQLRKQDQITLNAKTKNYTPCPACKKVSSIELHDAKIKGLEIELVSPQSWVTKGVVSKAGNTHIKCVVVVTATGIEGQAKWTDADGNKHDDTFKANVRNSLQYFTIHIHFKSSGGKVKEVDVEDPSKTSSIDRYGAKMQDGSVSISCDQYDKSCMSVIFFIEETRLKLRKHILKKLPEIMDGLDA